ncbi:YIP1 family protein [Cognatishimia activa]|uniref:YIP1 family protein n=1 Tax=Cognatishimia activa TaxID=1715691 RepID=UPI00222F1EBA|nr:YIP1 family protein [Cognatishimia activa]UZD92134.1 YIP1 family protein [Cognatishimia activa]
MSVTRDILATYRRPKSVALRRQADGPREDRALAVLMSACIVIFVAQWPRLSREAHLEQTDIMPLIGGALMGWVFMMPLVFYALAFVTQIILKAFGGTTGYKARMALFWALLACSPIILFQGLIAGFIGPGLLNNIFGFLWVAALLSFWFAGLSAAREETA